MINQQKIQKLLPNYTYYYLFNTDNCCMIRNPSNDKEIYIYETNDLDTILKQASPYYKPIKRKNCVVLSNKTIFISQELLYKKIFLKRNTYINYLLND